MEKMDSPERKYAHIVVLLELLPRKFNYFKDRAKIIDLLGSRKWTGGSASEQVDIILRQATSLQKVDINNLDFVSGTNQFQHIDSIAVSGYSPTSGVDKIPLGVQSRFLQVKYSVRNKGYSTRLYDQTFTVKLLDLQ